MRAFLQQRLLGGLLLSRLGRSSPARGELQLCLLSRARRAAALPALPRSLLGRSAMLPGPRSLPRSVPRSVLGRSSPALGQLQLSLLGRARRAAALPALPRSLLGRSAMLPRPRCLPRRHPGCVWNLKVPARSRIKADTVDFQTVKKFDVTDPGSTPTPKTRS